jgi:hypothetical protein
MQAAFSGWQGAFIWKKNDITGLYVLVCTFTSASNPDTYTYIGTPLHGSYDKDITSALTGGFKD